MSEEQTGGTRGMLDWFSKAAFARTCRVIQGEQKSRTGIPRKQNHYEANK